VGPVVDVFPSRTSAIDRPAARRSRPSRAPLDGAALSAVRRSLSRVRLVAVPLLLGDLAAITLAGLGAAAVAMPIVHLPARDAAIVMLALSLPTTLGYLLTGLYPGVALNPAVEFRQLSRVAAISLLGTAVLACLGQLATGCVLLLAVAAPLQFFLAPLARAAVRALCGRRSWWGYPTIIFGSGPAAATVVDNLLRNPQYGLRPVLVLDRADALGTRTAVTPQGDEGLATPSAARLGVPMVGQPRLASALAKRFAIQHAIVVLPDLSRRDATRILERYTRGIPHVTLTSAISPFAPGLPLLWRDTRDLAGVAGTEVRNRLLVATPRLVKRTMDLTLTIAGGLCLLPALAVIAVLVKLTSPGPVLFGHTRIGYRGQRFTAWKFRSMIQNGGEVLRQRLESDPAARAEWARDHKLKDDPRVTPIGRILRKASLDELPQLWNVIRGEMSLVGPRPIVDDEVVKYGKYYSVYKSVRPGITGLWQVSGRNDTTYEERLRYDEFYARNWSPWLDMHLLARTVSALCFRKGAY
jgi:Undecaprenyl-phosphate galactose phosphotransferase WbaP